MTEQTIGEAVTARRDALARALYAVAYPGLSLDDCDDPAMIDNYTHDADQVLILLPHLYSLEELVSLQNETVGMTTPHLIVMRDYASKIEQGNALRNLGDHWGAPYLPDADGTRRYMWVGGLLAGWVVL